MTKKLQFIATGFCFVLFFGSLGACSASARPLSHNAHPQATSETHGRVAQSHSGTPESPTAAAQAVKQWEKVGLYFTRSLDALEKAYHAQHGKYQTRMELYHSGSLNGPMRGITQKFGIGALQGWRWDFSIESSPDGNQYLASVHATHMPPTPGGMKALQCLPVFFSDQTGTIYEGKPIGCR